MKKFSFLQKLRNKIRLKGSLKIDIAKSVKIVNCTIRSNGDNNFLKLEEGVVLRYTDIEILGNNCSIIIEKNSHVGHDSYLSAKEGKTLKIGNNCSLSRNVKIMTSDGHPIYQNTERINLAQDITLEDNIWVADNVTILKGVRIAKNSILGMNSTVTKDVPAGSIAVGNPAKIVKQGVTWEE